MNMWKLILLVLLFSIRQNTSGQNTNFPNKIVSIYNNTYLSSYTNYFKSCTYIFIAPECPICLENIPSIKKINDLCKQTNQKLFLVFSGNTYTNRELQYFDKKYKIGATILYDSTYVLKKYFDAQVSPHSFIQTANKEIIYSGKINDKSLQLGKHKNKIQNEFVLNYLNSIAVNKPLKKSKNEAVGCIIE